MAKQPKHLRWKVYKCVDLLSEEDLNEFGGRGSDFELWELEGHDTREHIWVHFPGEDAFRFMSATDLHRFSIEFLSLVHQATTDGDTLNLYSETLGKDYVFSLPAPPPAFVSNAIKLFESTDRKLERQLELGSEDSRRQLLPQDAYYLGLLRGELNGIAIELGLKRIATREAVAKYRGDNIKDNDREEILKAMQEGSRMYPGNRRKGRVMKHATKKLDIKERTLHDRLRDHGIKDSEWLCEGE